MCLAAAFKQPLADGTAGKAGGREGGPCPVSPFVSWYGVWAEGEGEGLGVSFSLSLCRKRAKTTLDWRVMRSPPCWKTLCLQRSKSSRSKAAAKRKLNGECAPAKLAAQQRGGAATLAEPGGSAVGIPLPPFLLISGRQSCSSSLTV